MTFGLFVLFDFSLGEVSLFGWLLFGFGEVLGSKKVKGLLEESTFWGDA